MEYNLIGKIYKYFSCICKEQRARIGVYSMKHTRRRLLAIVTAVFMALTVWMVPTGFAAADDITEIKWTEGVTGGAIYFNKSTQTITKCDSAVTSAVIPSEIDGVPVTAIGSEAFAIFNSLTSLTIPYSVTSIGEDTFGNCKKLVNITVDDNNNSFSSIDGVLYDKNKTVLVQYPKGKDNSSYEIPASVATIGSKAFYNCDALTRVTIPDSVTVIKEHAFDDCSKLIDVAIPGSVTSIGDSAFRECKALTVVEFPDSVISIGEMAYYSCDNLKSVTISKGVTTIKDAAFGCSEELTKLTVAAGNTSFSSDNGVLYNKDKTVLLQYPIGNSRPSYTILDSVTTIGYGAFWNCRTISNVTLPNRVRNIEPRAFLGCSNLQNIAIPSNVETIGWEAFSSCSKLVSVTIPGNVSTIEYAAFSFCSKLKYVEISNGVTTIDSRAFSPCKSLTIIIIPDSVTSIGEYALPSATIYGYKGSYVDGYAAHRYPFEEIISAAPSKVSTNLYKQHDTLKVSWSKVAGADGYYVYYKKSTWKNYQQLGTTTSLSYSKAKLADGAKYKFAVYPYMNIGDQKYRTKNGKSSDYVYTLKKLKKPGVKKSSRSYVRVSWNNIPGESGYQIARSKSSTKNFKIVKRVSKNYKSTKIKTPRYKKYYYKVRAYKTVNGKRIYGPWSSGKSYRLR